jgi:subtilisin family serine protease
MKRIFLSLAILLILLGLGSTQASADQRFIVRTTNLPLLQTTCSLNSCQIVGALDGTENQLFLVTAPDGMVGDLVFTLLQTLSGVIDVEKDLVRPIDSGLAQVTTIPSGLNDRNPIDYYGAPVWDGYAAQPASAIVRLGDAQIQFNVTGAGIVADIDTGVDPNHPALAPVLLPGYDFTRNQPGGSEMNDLQQPLENTCDGCPAADVNHSTAAVLDHSTAAVLDDPYYAGFGHGTMVLGIVHLVAPTARLMPLKAFHADGTGYTSDILRAIYYAVQNQVNVINMSFDILSPDTELANAITYANTNNVICVASAETTASKK